MRDKIIYILLFMSFSFYAQGDMLLASRQQSLFVSDAILVLDPDVYYNPSSIDVSAVSDGDTVTTWEDLGANGLDATAINSIELNLVGAERMAQFNGGNSYFDVPESSFLEKQMGTDNFTIILREGAVVQNTGYYISKADSNVSNREYGLYISGNNKGLFGGSTTSFSPTDGTRRLYIVIITGATVDIWVDGTQVVTDDSVDTVAIQTQSVNIGGRSDGGYMANDGAQMDLISIIPSAITNEERLEIEAQFKIN
ncbi:LamG domain-containing protein [Maribacter sp. ACAM166]|uniref:LamG domain-containing protein n=1 Tax=Maribacter sp. ACAM166 TaxID=2508996 RepID=UPI0010FD5563|nr:LamG domain-containing protein [Maribacter sp. ACAM166]